MTHSRTKIIIYSIESFFIILLCYPDVLLKLNEPVWSLVMKFGTI